MVLECFGHVWTVFAGHNFPLFFLSRRWNHFCSRVEKSLALHFGEVWCQGEYISCGSGMWKQDGGTMFLGRKWSILRSADCESISIVSCHGAIN
jgi:hypothetical protein